MAAALVLLAPLALITGHVQNATCKEHLDLYLDSILTEEWALKMFDSSTKFPDGITTGNVVHLGNFDGCIAVDQGNFTGKYCLASAGSGDIASGNMHGDKVVPTRGLKHVLNLQTLLRTRVNVTISVGQLLQEVELKFAVCVPSSCDADDVQAALYDLLNPIGLNVTVSEENCQTNHGTKLRPGDWAIVGIITFFLLLVVLSTSYDIIQCFNKGPRSSLLLAFSVLSNGQRLLSISRSPDILGAINGIRFLSICWVVLGHCYVNSTLQPTLNFVEYLKFLTDWRRLYISNATISVDTFLMLSGALLSYMFLKEVQKINSFHVLPFYLHRYIRLTPAFAAVIMLHATLLPFLGSGPLWKSIIAESKASCETNWWTSLVYLNNYLNPQEQCPSHAWYLAVDMQLFVLSPLVLIPLWKVPKLGCAILVVLALIGWGIAFTVPYVECLTPILTDNDKFRNIRLQYFPTHTRFLPWLVGVALGNLLLSLKSQNKKLQLTKVKVIAGWLLALLLMVGSLALLLPFYQEDYVYHRLESALYISLHRPLWALGVAWVVFACVMGYGGPVNTILSWEVFQPFSRVSYCLYLIHPLIQMVIIGNVRTSTYFSDILVFSRFFGDLVISLAAATVLCLVFEFPFMVIEKALLGGGRTKDFNRKT